MSEPAASPCQTTLDRLLNGRLVLRQPARGHRAGTDALLLAAYAPVVSGHVIDAGAGVGTASLAYGLRAPAARLALLEIDPATAALAAENLVANRIDGEALAIDLMDASARRGAGLVNEAAALVLTNPPFLAAAAARVSPDPDRARAHAFSDEHGLAAWLRACLALLAPKGSFAMIHRADALGEILPLLAGRLGGLALRFVHPRSADPATRVLLRGVKGSKAPLAVLPPLILHGEDGAFTQEAAAIHGALSASPEDRAGHDDR